MSISRITASALLLLVTVSQGAFTADWQGLLDEWKRVDPQAFGKHQNSIQKIQKQRDKQLKDAADKAFKQQFETVFGKGVKPHEVYDFMKVVEAASAGDFSMALKEGGKMSVAKFLPKLNMYVTVLENTAKLIRGAEQVWVNELYVTQAYLNAVGIIDDAIRSRANPYVPSYLIRFDHNDPKNADIKRIFDGMRAREGSMFEDWRGKDQAHIDAVALLAGRNWAARFRSALKKDPTQRQIFNHFLYRITTRRRKRLIETFKDHYLYPLARAQAKEGRRAFSTAMARAVTAAAQAAGSAHPVRNIRLTSRVEDPARPSGLLIEFSFQGKPDTTYTAMLARGLDDRMHDRKSIDARTNANGLYQGKHVYPKFKQTGKWKLVFLVKDTDGEVRQTTRILDMRPYREPAKTDNYWSQIVGPHIQQLLNKAGEKYKWNMEKQAEINRGIAETHKVYQEYRKTMRSIMDMQKRDEKTMTKEELVKKYNSKSRVSLEFKRLDTMAKQRMAHMKAEEAKKIPFAKEAWKWQQFGKQTEATFKKYTCEKTLNLLLKNPFTAKVGMTAILQADLDRIEADKKRVAEQQQ